MQELGDYLVRYHWHAMKSAKSSMINMQHMVGLLGPSKDYRTITDHTCKLVIAHLQDRGYPASTINKKLSALRMALKYARKQGWMHHSVEIQHFKEGEGRLRFFTDNEENALLDFFLGVDDQDMHDYVIVSIDCGFRQGEVLAMEGKDVDDRKAAVWDTKNGRRRAVPMPPRARDVLLRRKREFPGTLFPMSKDSLKYRWQNAREALGFVDDAEFVPHVMRHTFCTRLANLGVSVQVIKKLAGHERIETTLKYVRLSDEALFAAIQKLGQAHGAHSAPLI